ncbi:MAG TPA: ABC transporter permease subunit [Spirochaetia bacterium]|nr:ABC transporter permease subunit [Spirochaetia bacterium]
MRPNAAALAPRTTWKEVVRHRTLYLFLLPAVVLCLVFFYRPMIGLIMAFQNYKVALGMYHSPFVGLKNFQEFLQNPRFYQTLRNTLVINGLSIAIGFPLPIIFALVLNTLKDGSFKKVTQTISYLPHFISWVVIAGLMYKLLDQESGAVNLLIKLMGGKPVAYMRQAQSFWGVITVVAIWKELGWNTIIFLAALASVDVEQYEAAIIDGASGWQKLWGITLPAIAPVIALMFIFTIGNLFNANGNVSFDAIFNMRNALISDTANTIDYFIYQEGVQSNRMSFAAAIGFAQNLISFIVVMGANAISRKIRGYGAF